MQLKLVNSHKIYKYTLKRNKTWQRMNLLKYTSMYQVKIFGIIIKITQIVSKVLQSSGLGSQWYLNIFLILLLIGIFTIQFRCLPQLQEFQSIESNNLLGKQMRSAKPFFPFMTEKKGIIQTLLKVGFYIYSG